MDASGANAAAPVNRVWVDYYEKAPKPTVDGVPLVDSEPLPAGIVDMLTPGRRYQLHDTRLWGPAGSEAWLPHVRQGGLGSCTVMAVLGAYALQQPGKLREMARELSDGSIAIRLPGREEVAFTRKLITKADGDPKYARPQERESWAALWPAMFEKAVSWTRPADYFAMDRGWMPQSAMAALTGIQPQAIDRPADVVADLKARLAAGEPVVATTVGDVEDLRIFGNHTYVVRKVVERPGAEPLIKAWNPWGTKHPVAMTLEQFRGAFDAVVAPAHSYAV